METPKVYVSWHSEKPEEEEPDAMSADGYARVETHRCEGCGVTFTRSDDYDRIPAWVRSYPRATIYPKPLCGCCAGSRSK